MSETSVYIQGPEPMGWAAASSSERLAGVTLMMPRRSLMSEKLGMVTLTVRVVSSFFSMDSIMVRKETYIMPSALARSNEWMTSSGVTGSPVEKAAPSRRVISQVLSSTHTGSPTHRPSETL